MGDQGQGQVEPTQISGANMQDTGMMKKEKHWWQNNPIRRLSLNRTRTCSETSADVPPDSPTTPEHDKVIKGRRFSLGESIEKHAEKRERWVRNYNVPPECFIPPWT